MMEIVYGIDASEKGNPNIQAVENVLRLVEVAFAPGAFLVDLIPARTPHIISTRNLEIAFSNSSLLILASQTRAELVPWRLL
jgi:hypothetical protein